MKLARWTQSAKPSFIREILKVTQMPDVISFAGGLPAPELFPVADLSRLHAQALAEDGPRLLQYSPTEGDPLLRSILSRRLTERQNPAGPDDIIFCNGSQHGLDLVAKAFIDPGDAVLVEDPTYLGALQAFRPYGTRLIAVPTDEQGMVPEHLEALIEREQPKLVYVMPTFQNPRGTSMGEKRRQEIAAICKAADVCLVEDDPYGELRFRGTHLPAMRHYWDQAIYLGTFSKVMAPGLRLGWIVAPPNLMGAIKLGIQSTCLNINPLSQRVAAMMLADPVFETHMDRIRSFYGERMEVMLDCLRTGFPEGMTWTEPEGGLFIWATMPDGVRSMELVQFALERKVAFVPGEPFYVGAGGEHSMRLNFSNSTPDQIREGMQRLRDAIDAVMAVR